MGRERYTESELLKQKRKQLARNLRKGEIKLEIKMVCCS